MSAAFYHAAAHFGAGFVTFSYRSFKQAAVSDKICYNTYMEFTKFFYFDDGGENAAWP